MKNSRLFTLVQSRFFSVLPAYAPIPMPTLSPSMKNATIKRWLVKEGGLLKPTQIFLEVETNSLLQDQNPNEKTVLEIESHEEGFVAKIFAREGDVVKPEDVIGIVCNEVTDVASFADTKASQFQANQSGDNKVSDLFFPIKDTVLNAPPISKGRGPFCWQAYVKLDHARPHSCSN